MQDPSEQNPAAASRTISSRRKPSSSTSETWALTAAQRRARPTFRIFSRSPFCLPGPMVCYTSAQSYLPTMVTSHTELGSRQNVRCHLKSPEIQAHHRWPRWWTVKSTWHSREPLRVQLEDEVFWAHKECSPNVPRPLMESRATNSTNPPHICHLLSCICNYIIHKV